MDILDKFFKKFSYKFPKGYPDINDDQDMLMLEGILKEMEIDLGEGIAEKKIVQTLIKQNPGYFDTQSKDKRIANLKKISAEEFVEIVKKTFDTDEVIIHPPNSGPNKKPATHSSSKFNMFEFEVEGKKYLIILSGGASANLGQDFEDQFAVRLKNSIGIPLDDIEDEEIKTLLIKLNIDPLSITSVEQTGGIDTKRPINPEKGAQDRGKVISDIVINTKSKPYYLSIKNKTGDTIYNGGTFSSIEYDKINDKITFNKSSFENDVLKRNILDILGIDVNKIVQGLNNYILKTGETPSFQTSNANLNKVQNLLGSAVDYGYYYVREDKNNIKIIPIMTAEDTSKLLGKVDNVLIKYPGKGVKSTYARIPLSNSEQGLRYAEVQIRNTSGGIGKPSLKIQTK